MRAKSDPAMVRVGRAGSKGRGVFANVSISRGQLIERAPYIEIAKSEVEALETTVLVHYVYDSGAGKRAVALGFGSLYNHADNANTEYRFDKNKKEICFYSLRAIEEGAELTVDYGFHPTDPVTWDQSLKDYAASKAR